VGADTKLSKSHTRAPEEVAAVWVDVDQLKVWASNPRKNDVAAQKLAPLIKRFGFGSPIIARKADGEIIAGHTRLKAAQILGLTQVPVRYMDLDPAEAHLMALADNRVGEAAEWDSELLAEVMSAFSFEDIELAGWSQKDLDKLGEDFASATPPDDFKEADEDLPTNCACPKCGYAWSASK